MCQAETTPNTAEPQPAIDMNSIKAYAEALELHQLKAMIYTLLNIFNRRNKGK